MNKQILSFAGTLAALAAVAVLIVLFSHFVPRQSSPAAAPTATEANEISSITVPRATSTTHNQPLGYFIHAESDVLPLQPWQLTPSAERPTSTPNPGWTFNLSILEAQQRAGFNVLMPGWLPEVVSFGGASYQPDHNIVRIFYPMKSGAPEEYGLVLQEERDQFSNDCDDLCGRVGAGAQVDTVQIGDIPGEYTVGAWIFTDNGPLWEDTNARKVLRWQANGISYQLSYTGWPDSVTENDMIAITERLR